MTESYRTFYGYEEPWSTGQELKQHPVVCPMAQELDGELTFGRSDATTADLGSLAMSKQQIQPESFAYPCAMDAMFDDEAPK